MKNIKVLLVALALFLYGCEQHEVTPRSNVGEGEWLLYESGYSPGAGYQTVGIPSEPAQKIKFLEDGQLVHSIEGWEDYKFYLIEDDPNSDRKILSLYKEKPLDSDVTKSTTSYNFEIDDGGNLKLYYRFCIEGCHLGFRPV